MEDSRPKSINIIGAAGIIMGILIIAAGFGGSFQVTGILRSLLCLIGIVSFGISLIVSSSFVIGLREWARKLFSIQMVLVMGCGTWEVTQVFVRASKSTHFWWSDFLGFGITFLLIPMHLIYCLTRPKVKAQFK